MISAVIRRIAPAHSAEPLALPVRVEVHAEALQLLLPVTLLATLRTRHSLREAGAGSSNLLTPTSYFLNYQVLNNPTVPCWVYLKSACHNFVTLVL